MIDQAVFNNREDTRYLRALVDTITVAPTLEAVEALLMDLETATKSLLNRIGEHYDD